MTDIIRILLLEGAVSMEQETAAEVLIAAIEKYGYRVIQK